MRLISYDCEVFAYDWLVTLKDKETGVYTCIWNDNEALKMALSDDCIYVGFNSKHYDQYIIKAIAAGFAPEEIKKVNDFIIAGGQGWQCPLLDGIYFRLSSKMYLIKQYHPEKADETSSGFEWSEMGMANLFGLLYSHEARYCPEHKSWYTYHEGAWRKDEGAILVSEKIKDFVRLMILYCGEIEDDDTRKSYTGFVNKMGDRRMRDRILKDATGELRISAVQFDADPYLINCLNGTYDLRDFSFREHSWDDFLTMQTAFSHTISKTVTLPILLAFARLSVYLKSAPPCGAHKEVY